MVSISGSVWSTGGTWGWICGIMFTQYPSYYIKFWRDIYNPPRIDIDGRIGTKNLGEEYGLVKTNMQQNWYLQFDVNYKLMLQQFTPTLGKGIKCISPDT